MSNLQNINLQAEQNKSIFANRKAADLKEEKNKQGAFWPGYENIDPKEELTTVDDTNPETQDDSKQLTLFPKSSHHNEDVLIYESEKVNHNKERFFYAFLERNIDNKSTKLFFEGEEQVSGNISLYSELTLEAHLLFDKVLVISKRYYESGVHTIGEGDLEEFDGESRTIIKIIKFPTLLTIVKEIDLSTALNTYALFSFF